MNMNDACFKIICQVDSLHGKPQQNQLSDDDEYGELPEIKNQLSDDYGTLISSEETIYKEFQKMVDILQ